MFDGGATSSRSVLAQLERTGTWGRLVRLAYWSARERAAAEDLVSDTLMRVLDPEDLPWNGKGRFLTFMSFCFRAVFKTWMRRMSFHEVPVDSGDVEELVRDDRPLADEVLEQRRTEGRLALLADRLFDALGSDDPLARRCLDLHAAGMSAKEQAAALGCTEERVFLLHAVIKRRAARIREEYDATEGDRMAGLRLETSARRPGDPVEGPEA